MHSRWQYMNACFPIKHSLSPCPSASTISAAIFCLASPSILTKVFAILHSDFERFGSCQQGGKWRRRRSHCLCVSHTSCRQGHEVALYTGQVLFDSLDRTAYLPTLLVLSHNFDVCHLRDCTVVPFEPDVHGRALRFGRRCCHLPIAACPRSFLIRRSDVLHFILDLCASLVSHTKKITVLDLYLRLSA